MLDGRRSPILKKDEATRYRSACMRLSYLAQDRLDLAETAKAERILLFRVILESMFASVSFVFSAGRVTQVSRFRVFMFQCSIRCIDTCVLVVLDMRNVEHLLQE